MSRFFTKEHEWLEQQDETWRLGITAYAAESLGDIVFVDLPEPDSYFEANDVICGVESVKTAADVFTPWSGTVVAVNDALTDSPELLNQDPEANWLLELRPVDDFSTAELMDEATYQAWLAEGN